MLNQVNVETDELTKREFALDGLVGDADNPARLSPSLAEALNCSQMLLMAFPFLPPFFSVKGTSYWTERPSYNLVNRFCQKSTMLKLYVEICQ